jgi:caa(3)-type oxidase subunit IV
VANTAHEHRETIHETHIHVVPSTASTLTTYCVLLALALVALLVGFSDLGPWKVLASLGVACVQASVLSLFFMDLRQADKLTWLCVGASIFWTGLLFLFTLTDYFTRHYAAL